MKLENLKNQEIIFQIVDILCSEYGWSIEYVQNLTITEISGLIQCICKRKGISLELSKKEDKEKSQVENMIGLAQRLGASSQQLDDLKKGKRVIL